MNKVFTILEKQTSFRFAYNSEIIAGINVANIRVSNMPLRDCLALLFKDLPVDYVIIGNQIIIRLKKALPAENKPLIQRDSIFLMPVKPLPGVILSEMPGIFFNLISIQVKSTNTPEINDSKPFRIYSDSTLVLKTVWGPGLLQTMPGQPALLAGIDVTPGFLIKGETEPHTVVMDEMPLYNTGRFFGSTGMVDQFSFEKAELSSIIRPASLGDRPGPVIRATMKEGNFHDWGFMVRPGNLDAGIQLHGPIVTNKASFIINAHRSTFDLLLKPAIHGNYFKNYQYYGISAKVSFRPSEKNLFSLSFFNGGNNNAYSRDSAQSKSIYYDNDSENSAISLHWNHHYTPRLLSKASLSYNHYNQTISASQERYYAILHSNIKQSNFSFDVVYNHDTANNVSIGIQYAFTSLGSSFIYDRLLLTESSLSIDPSAVQAISGHQISVYLADDIKFTPTICGYMGLRLPVYMANAVFLQLEPRISLSFLVSSSTTLRFSYNRYHQHFSQINSPNASFPADIWIISNKEIKPQKNDQISIDIHKQFNERFYGGLVVFYRYTGNQTLFKGEKTPSANDHIEKFLIKGKGTSYGSEIFMGKDKGKLTGIVSYSFSYDILNFAELKNGNDFPGEANRPHILKSLFEYRIGQNSKIISRFIAASGKSTVRDNIAEGYSESPLFDNPTGNEKKEQNNYRLSPFHRLDVGICYSKTFQIMQSDIDTRFELMLNNVYAKENTIFTYRSINTVTNQMEVNEVSLFPFLPSLTLFVYF